MTVELLRYKIFLSLIFFQLFQRRFLVFFCYFIFNTYWEKRCTIQLHRPLSKKSNAAISSGFSFQTLSTQLPQTQPAETWYFMFLGCRIFFFSLPATKRGRHSRAELSGIGTEEQVPTISPVFSAAATLHFSCNWNHICNTSAEMKQL